MQRERSFVVHATGVFGHGGATAVRVEEGRVAAVGGPEVIRPGDEVLDGDCGWLLPGLVDAHVHLGAGTSRIAALHGVTTVIDQFSTPDLLADERERAGRSVCAHLQVAGIGATAPGGHPTMAYAPIPYVTGPGDAETFVQARVDEGATHLKVIYDDGTGAELDLAALSEASLRALVAAAHARGLVVVAHVSSAHGAVLVSRCGVDVLGHVPFEPLTPAQVSEIASARTSVIATLSIVDGFPARDGRLPLEVDPVLAHRLTPAWARVLRAQAQRWMPPGELDIAAARANVAALHAAGVRILAGTDAPNPGLVVGLSLHRELAQLVGAGLTPVEAIEAATSVPCDVFGLAGRGRIEVGAQADLVLVGGDPTSDVTATGLVQRVWVAGCLVDPASGDDEAESAQIAWIRHTNAKVLSAVAELWPEWVPTTQPETILLTGCPSVDAVLPALTHPHKEIRQEAAVALGTLRDPAAAPALVARLRDEPDFFVRETLTWAATAVGDHSRPLVEELAESGDPAVATQAMHVLGKIASPLSIPVLSRHTGAAEAGVAAKARAALARIGDPAGIPLLTRHLGEGDRTEQDRLTIDLAAFGGTAPLLTAVVDRLRDDDPVARRHAADVLTHVGATAQPAGDAVTPLLDDHDAEVRLAAAMAAYEIGGPARDALAAYAGPDPRLQALARRAGT